MKDDNILIFPQSRCRLGSAPSNQNSTIKRKNCYYDLQESELFLARLLHNIAEQYQLDPSYAAQALSPFIPGLHSLVETVLNYCDSPTCNTEDMDVINHLLAETLINSFRHAQNLAYE